MLTNKEKSNIMSLWATQALQNNLTLLDFLEGEGLLREKACKAFAKIYHEENGVDLGSVLRMDVQRALPNSIWRQNGRS